MQNNDEKAMRACIEWLESEAGCDVCGHCAYYNEEDYSDENAECPHQSRSGSKACVDGMIEFFRGEVSNG